ncbi:hypothetical protein FISHEDRAFT_15450, partial [Fistulina hepatica ATCC 64428]
DELDRLPQRTPYKKATEEPPRVIVHSMAKETVNKFRKAYEEDAALASTLKELTEQNPIPGTRFFKTDDGLLFFRDADWNPKLCVPKGLRQEILTEIHENALESAH